MRHSKTSLAASNSPDSAIEEGVEAFLAPFDAGLTPDFPALPNLVDVVAEYAPEVTRSGLGAEGAWQTWLGALAITQQYVQAEDRAPPTGRKGNPLGGQFTKYPVCACLLQDPDVDVVSQYKGLLTLLLAALVANSGKAEGQPQLRETAIELRRAGSEETEFRAELLRALPAFDPQNAEDSLSALRAAVERLSAHPAVQKSVGASFCRALSHLLDLDARPAQRKSKPSDSKGQSALGGTERRAGDEDEDEPPALDADVVEEPAERSSRYEPADEQLRLIAKDGPEPLSPAALVSEGQRSRYWLLRSRRRTPVDRTLLNPIERRIFANHLRVGLASVDLNPRILVLGLLYVTALDIGGVVSAPLGANGIFDLGIYRRRLVSPPSAFRPQRKAQHQWQDPATAVELPLPSMFHVALDAAVSSGQPTLGEALGLDEGDALAAITAELEPLRDAGRYGFILPRIQAQLMSDLSAYERNPALAYLLAADPTSQRPPSLSYYLASPLHQLVSAYQRATARLLPP